MAQHSSIVLLYDANGLPLAYHDLDSGAGTESNLGVSLRKTASGGSVELGTPSDPMHTTSLIAAGGILNKISTDNSTTAVLGSNATYTGTWESCEHFGEIGVMIIASHASATDGLKIEQSSDGVNVDSDDKFTLQAAAGKQFSVRAQGKFFRVTLTNGATVQTYLRLQTKLHTVRGKPSSHRIQDSIVTEDDAELVKAIIAARKPDGTFTNMTVDDQGAIRVVEVVSTGNVQQAVRAPVKNGGNSSLLVDGDPTPVVFTYPADSLKDLRIYEIRVVFSAGTTQFGAGKFGGIVGGLVNGLLMEIVSDGITSELAVIKINEDFLTLQPSVNLLVDQTGSSDVITAGLNIGGLMVLKAGTSDVVRVTVRDDISLGGTNYLKCFVYGLKDQ